MNFRVTPQGRTNQIIGHLQRNSARLNVYQEQMATGKRLMRPSDGPTEMAVVRSNKAEGLRLDTNLKNIQGTQFILQNSEDALLELREILTEASQIVIEADNSTNDDVVDSALASASEKLIDRLLTVVNRRLPDGRYLFSGQTTDTVPFVVESYAPEGHPTVVTYQGSLQNVEAMIGSGQTVETIRSGKDGLEDAFQVLIGVREDLKLASTDPTRSASLNQHLDEIDQITRDVLARLDAQGTDSENLQAIRIRTEDAQFELRKMVNELESADLAETILNLQTQENAFQATLLAAARINNLSLADFL